VSARPEVQVIPQEARPYQGLRAGIVSRVLANAIDLAVVVVALVVGYLGWAGFLFLLRGARFHFPTPRFAVLFAIGGVLLVGYFTAAWSTTGRTYGDHVLGLRVVNHRGLRMRVAGALLRAVFCALVPILLFWAAFSKENRSVQDLVLRTSVIYDWEQQPRRSRDGEAS
jgi:uncharacterized RDD family membrane protein YckC